MSFAIPLTNRENYYCSLLSNEEHNACLQCVQSLSRGKLDVTVNLTNITDSTFDNIARAIDYGYPELFFVDKQFSIRQLGNSLTLMFNSKYPLSRVQGMWVELNERVNEAVDFANSSSGSYQKLMAVNEFLCNSVVYRNDGKKSNGDAFGALVDGFARCEGISKAAQLIIERLGFETFQAIGKLLADGQSEDHSWNIVKYDDNYYNFDFTLDIGNSLYSIPCTDFMFLSDADAYTNRTSQMNYPNCTNDSNTTWARNDNFASCSADVARVKVEQYGKHFYATVKLNMDIAEDELNERIPYWIQNELSGYSHGRMCGYRYFNFLKVLTFFMLNDID